MNHVKSYVQVKEYGLLVETGDDTNPNHAEVSTSAFNWLMSNGLSIAGRELVRVKRMGKKLALQVVNFVGVLDTPCGTRIEILPKIYSDRTSIEASRKTLLKMLAVVENLKLEQFNNAHLQVVNQPLIEVLISQFLSQVSLLLKKGLRSEYQRVDAQRSFLKGRLNTVKQMRQRPGRDHIFQISYDTFSVNRAENRLILSAVNIVSRWTRSSQNQRLARELIFAFDGVNKSNNHNEDFKRWSKDRNLTHYRNLESWCKLILFNESPLTMSGNTEGVSFLFPMEVLFERYVEKKLSKLLPSRFSVKGQIKGESLTSHNGQNWFNLRPDIAIYDNGEIAVIADTKWKIINENLNTSKDKYYLAQSDMYQLFAYGEKYLKGQGSLVLIYPKNENFLESLPSFEFKPGLLLHVVPYDLDKDELRINAPILF